MSTLLASLYLEEFVELKDAAFAAQVALERAYRQPRARGRSEFTRRTLLPSWKMGCETCQTMNAYA